MNKIHECENIATELSRKIPSFLDNKKMLAANIREQIPLVDEMNTS